MTDKDELLNRILFAVGDCTSEQKSRIIIAMAGFNVTRETTEIAIVDGDRNLALIKRFLMAKTVAGRTERTLGQYKNILLKVNSDMGKDFLALEPDDIRMYLAKKLVVDKVSAVGCNNIWRVMSSFYGFLVKEELISKNPMLKVDTVKQPKVKKQAFTDDEVEKIRNSCKNLRDKALIETLLSTWCRVSEVEQMDIRDINRDGSMMVRGKGQKDRIVYLNAKAKYAITEYLEARTDKNEALFVSLDKPYDRLKKSAIEIVTRSIGKRTGIDKCHPHRFRRTGATFALRSGMPIELVSKLLGHEDLSTTQIYLDIDEHSVSEAHRKYVN